VNTLAPKLVLTPLLVASTSLAGRRWGPALSGWLVALPLTSGPIALFIALESGPEVARQAVAGSLAGAIAQVAFATAYVLVSRRTGWVPSVVAAAIAFFVAGFAFPPVSPIATYGSLAVLVAAFLLWLGRRPSPPRVAIPPPTWDIPARVVVATILVILISGVAPLIGGRAAGIIATFPVYVSVLTTFAHRTHGSHAASEVLRGLVTGLLGFGAFFLAAGWLLAFAGIAASFAGALLAGVAVQCATYPLLRHVADDRRATSAPPDVDPGR
jgi:hypothetical protein